MRIRRGHKLPKTTEGHRGIFKDTAKPLRIHHLLSDPYYSQCKESCMTKIFKQLYLPCSFSEKALRKGM